MPVSTGILAVYWYWFFIHAVSVFVRDDEVFYQNCLLRRQVPCGNTGVTVIACRGLEGYMVTDKESVDFCFSIVGYNPVSLHFGRSFLSMKRISIFDSFGNADSK